MEYFPPPPPMVIDCLDDLWSEQLAEWQADELND